MFRGLRSSWTNALWVVSLVAACNGDDPSLGTGDQGTSDTSTDDGTTGDGATLEEQVAAFIALRCERAAECDCAGLVGSDACIESDTAIWDARIAAGEARELTRNDSCIAANLATLETAGCRWASEVLEGTHMCGQFCAAYHGDRALAQPCDAYDALVSDCAEGLLCESGVCVDPCDALTGLPAGQTCGNESIGPYEDCSQTSYCDWGATSCVPFAQAGDDCSATQCGNDLWCDWDTSRCIVTAGLGESCASNGRCQSDLFCEFDSASPTCRARGLAGDPCGSVPCAEGLTCDGTQCTVPPSPGQPCAGSACAEGSLCDWNTNVCVAPPEAGSACLFGECAAGAWCDTAADPNGVCTARQATGQPCTGHSQCETSYCPRGYCEARPGEGEDCSVVNICARGLVCNGETCQPTRYRGPAACVYPGW